MRQTALRSILHSGQTFRNNVHVHAKRTENLEFFGKLVQDLLKEFGILQLKIGHRGWGKRLVQPTHGGAFGVALAC
jgi:hypothetical protein